ncbi:hypothetical protein [Spirillospora sp. NPDC047279]
MASWLREVVAVPAFIETFCSVVSTVVVLLGAWTRTRRPDR